MSKNRNDFDFLDELFDELETSGNQSVNDFGEMIKTRFSEEIKKNGYDNFSDMILGGIGNSSAHGKVHSRSYGQTAESRFDYFINAVINVSYGYQYRGYYREAHQEAIDKYIQMAKNNPEDLTVLERNVIREIRMIRRNKRSGNDKEYQGYLDGLNLVKKELENSKMYMMGKIADAVIK